MKTQLTVTAQPSATQLLVQWMAQTGASAADVSRVAGVTESAVSRWLSGEKGPKLATVKRIIALDADAVAAVRPRRGRPPLADEVLAGSKAKRVEAGELVRLAMQLQGYAPADLARMFEVTRPTISRWLSGGCMPPAGAMQWARTVIAVKEVLK